VSLVAFAMETNIKIYITAKPRFNGLMRGVIANVCYNQRKGYSQYSRASVVVEKMHYNGERRGFESLRGE
jgi:hypothetical protein